MKLNCMMIYPLFCALMNKALGALDFFKQYIFSQKKKNIAHTADLILHKLAKLNEKLSKKYIYIKN